jgi:hypothetical protein
MTTETAELDVLPSKITFGLLKRADLIDRFQLTQTAKYPDSRYATKWMIFTEGDLAVLYAGLDGYFNNGRKCDDGIIVKPVLDEEPPDA